LYFADGSLGHVLPSQGGVDGPICWLAETSLRLFARSINLPDTADMSGGTKLLRGHIWLVLIGAVDLKQANVVMFFLANTLVFDSIVPYLKIEGAHLRILPNI